MSRHSRKQRQRFGCGHRGFGKYCHCCADRTARLQSEQRQRQANRQQWQALFAEDGIDLRHLPKAIVTKARGILSCLEQGTQYWQLSGKRLTAMREVIRIPVTRRYRLLCRDDGDRITPVKVISHEAYNTLYKSSKRLSQLLR